MPGVAGPPPVAICRICGARYQSVAAGHQPNWERHDRTLCGLCVLRLEEGRDVHADRTPLGRHGRGPHGSLHAVHDGESLDLPPNSLRGE